MPDAELVKQVGEQHRAYKKLRDAVELARRLPKSRPVELPPSEKYPHIRTFNMKL